jgi:hypothetical protein
MEVTKKIIAVLISVLLLFFYKTGKPCSSYKVTSNGKTMVGSNYDNWLTTPRIWFETNGYGASFSGARFEEEHGFAPQTGLNEFGLSFISLSAVPGNGIPDPNKKQIASRTVYLKDILHTCKTVEEVKKYIEQYDHSSLLEEVFLYVDRSGKYLVVEPYTSTLGSDAKYVLANFCPSTIDDFSKIKQAKYVKGIAFLKNKIDSSLAFCTALSDTMHVCREKLGDGTLLTSILDLNQGVVHLYFYHDYKHHVQFNLKEELLKGNHFYEISALFPSNSEFIKLIGFKTPLNNPVLQWFMIFCIVLFMFTGLFFLINFFIKRQVRFRYIKLLLVVLSIALTFYSWALARIENVFYFPAPYKDPGFALLNITSYIPYLLFLLIIPFIMLNKNIFKELSWGKFSRWLFAVNTFTYTILITLFFYWGFYNVF